MDASKLSWMLGRYGAVVFQFLGDTMNAAKVGRRSTLLIVLPAAS